VILIVAFAFAGGPRPAVACSCPLLPPDEYASRATVFFTGVVTSVSGIPLGLVCRSDSPVAATFEVETVYKGDVPRTITVRTVVSGASCGYTFEVGKRYTVFPWSLDGRLDAGLCRGNIEGAIVAAQYGLPEGRPPRD
jgi:hypothetical protein